MRIARVSGPGRRCAVAAVMVGALGSPAVAGDELLVSSYFANKVGRYDETTGAYLGELDPLGGVLGAQAVAVGRDGRLYVASEGNDSILRYDLNTFAFVDVFVTSGSGGLNGPTGVVFDANGDLLVASFDTDQVLKYSGVDGSFSGIFVGAGAGGLDGPDTGMSIGPDGNLYVPSYWNSRVIRYNGQTGVVIDTFITAGLGGLSRPRQIEYRPDGYWYVTSEANGRVLRYTATGTQPAVFHSTFIIGGGLIQPIGIAWDKSGFVYVTDGVADTVRKYDAVSGAFAGVFVAAGSGGVNGPTFVKFVPRTRFTSIQSFSVISTLSLGCGDADGDGDDDIHVAESGGAPNKLYVNDGNGAFTERNEFGTGTSFVTLLADCDNDGDRDCAMGSAANQQSFLYRNGGGGVFAPESIFGANRTCAMAWADYDLDGDLDLAVGNGIFANAQQNHLYTNNGNGTFTQSAQFGLFRTITVVWGDYDNDGDPDLAVGNGAYSGTDPNFLYTNNGNGTFTGVQQFGSGQTASMAWGDCDNDGDLDLAVGHWGGGPAGISELYINNGNGTFTGRPEFGTRDTNGLNWADFDNDGDLDLVVANGDFTSADQNYLYVNDGTGHFVELKQFGLGSTDVIAWADFDLDGDLDAAVGNEHTPGINEVYRNDENDGNWLKLNLIGHRHDKGPGYSNRDAVGAIARVYAAGHVGQAAYLRATRRVDAHGGFTGQNTHDLHFGLPADPAADIRITWPGSAGSRITQDLLNVARGQRVTVHETAPCYPDCNADGGLTVADFGCFQTKFVLQDPYADCNADGGLTVADFGCFQTEFVVGCP